MSCCYDEDLTEFSSRSIYSTFSRGTFGYVYAELPQPVCQAGHALQHHSFGLFLPQHCGLIERKRKLVGSRIDQSLGRDGSAWRWPDLSEEFSMLGSCKSPFLGLFRDPQTDDTEGFSKVERHGRAGACVVLCADFAHCATWR